MKKETKAAIIAECERIRKEARAETDPHKKQLAGEYYGGFLDCLLMVLTECHTNGKTVIFDGDKIKIVSPKR